MSNKLLVQIRRVRFPVVKTNNMATSIQPTTETTTMPAGSKEDQAEEETTENLVSLKIVRLLLPRFNLEWVNSANL